MDESRPTDADMDGLSLDDRRRERRRLKTRHTSIVKQIDTHIRSSLSRSKLVSLVDELNILTDACVRCNDGMRSLMTADDDLHAAAKWSEDVISIAVACRKRVDRYLLQRADDVSSVVSSRSSAAAAYHSRRKALEIELERVKLEHEQAERQRQLQVTHERERFNEEQEQLILKRQIDALDEQERTLYADDESHPPSAVSFPHAEKVESWLSANGAPKNDNAFRSKDVPQPTSRARNRSSLERRLPLTSAVVPSDVNPVLADDGSHQRPAAPLTAALGPDRDNMHPSLVPTAPAGQLPYPCHSLLASRLPKMEIRKFSGRSRDWPMFIASFRQSVHDILDSDADRLNILRELLEENVKRSVSKYLYDPKCYEQLIGILERRYGNPQKIIRACLKSIEALPSWKDFDLPGLRRFSNELQGIVATLSLGNHQVEIESAGNLMAVVKKMPERLRDDWGRNVVENFSRRRPNLRDLSDWLETRREAAETVSDESDDEIVTKPRQAGHRLRRPSVYATVARPGGRSPLLDGPADQTSSGHPCVVCRGNHRLAHCKAFREMPIERRADIIKTNNCCYRCLENDHVSRNCSSKRQCRKNGCNALHHPLFHGAPRLYPTRPDSVSQPTQQGPKPFTGTVNHKPRGTKWACMLPIVPLLITGADGRKIRTMALLDKGSEISMIRLDLADRLRLTGPTELCRFATFHADDPLLTVRRVSFTVHSQDGLFELSIDDAYAVPKLHLNRKPVDIKDVVSRYEHLRELEHELPPTNEDVMVLIGIDNPTAHEIIESKIDPDRPRSPQATLTPFGWCLIGPFAPCNETYNRKCLGISVASRPDRPSLSELMERLFNADVFGIKPKSIDTASPEEQRALTILRTTTRFNGERYEAGLLWRIDNPRLPDNRLASLKRFYALERRLLNDPRLAAKYAAVVDEYLSHDHAKVLTVEEANDRPIGRTWYLPHHPVFNPNKPSKLRVVFDAAAKSRGTSLNTELLKGPDFLASLVGILLRFRLYRYAVTADIVKMFHQVRVRQEDVSALRFFWRSPGTDDEPSEYQMNVQIFGARSSPSVCAYALRQAAKDAGNVADLVHSQIVDHFYVDNWLASFRTLDEAAATAETLTSALMRAGFPLAQWRSTDEKILAPICDRTMEPANMDLDEVPIERTLGLSWNSATDDFVAQFNIRREGKTKRQLLRAIASIFDPLGFFAPLTLQAKLLMQTIWKSQVDWDEDLPDTILDRWERWVDSLTAAKTIAIRRCLTPVASPWSTVQLHTFSDASEIGLGAVAFLRFETANGVHVSFVMAKSKVAPMKPITIPRMELNGALMAVRLATMIREELRIAIDGMHFHVDSTTVLRWISSTSYRFHTYVRNRIAEIHEYSKPSQWHYVPSRQNPADCCSRGLNTADLRADNLFYCGPDFLLKHQSLWPTPPEGVQLQSPVDDPEVYATDWIGSLADDVDSIDDLVNRVSRLTRLIRVMAYVSRFCANIRRPPDASRRRMELDVAEIDDAFMILIRKAQSRAYSNEIVALSRQRRLPSGSSLVKLTPFVDSRRILCVGGRLENAPMPLDSRHPVILPRSHRLTELVVWDTHERLAHASADRTLHEIRKLYWIPKGRMTVRRILNRCLKCKRLYAFPKAPRMAALPKFRLTPGLPAFAHCGVDYFGPFEVNIFRRLVKRWACLFTCLTTRAVHLEMAYSLDTDSFLSVLFRFEQRRGTPAAYWSDNGTNIVGAKREIQECIQRLDHARITETLSIRRVAWHFNPPAAPHMGGAWEALIRSAKRALTAILYKRALTDEVLITALCYVENLLNGRPLAYVPSDGNEAEILTPHHLLTGRSQPNFPPDLFTDSDFTFRKRWRYAQALATHFWRRWMKEYVPSLIERGKWTKNERNMSVGDVVVLVDPNTPRATWPLGRVIAVYPGKDGNVRSADVALASTTVHRSVNKLLLLREAD